MASKTKKKEGAGGLLPSAFFRAFLKPPGRQVLASRVGGSGGFIRARTSSRVTRHCLPSFRAPGTFPCSSQRVKVFGVIFSLAAASSVVKYSMKFPPFVSPILPLMETKSKKKASNCVKH